MDKAIMGSQRTGVLVLAFLMAPLAGAVAQPLQSQTATYSKAIHGGGSAQVVYQESGGVEKILSVALATSVGDVVLDANYAGSLLTDYSIALSGTTTTYAVAISDLGSGSWQFTIDYGSAGAIVATANTTAGVIQLDSATVSSCSALTDGAPFQALLEVSAALRGIAQGPNTDTRGRIRMWTAVSLIDVAATAPVLLDCPPHSLSLPGGGKWYPCTAQANYGACVTCCEMMHDVVGLVICAGVAMSNPWAGVACATSMAMNNMMCSNECHNVYYGGVNQGAACGEEPFPGGGTCEHLCVDGIVIPGDCAAPLICCISDEE